MKFAYSCDIVRNNNPKSKRFGQYGIVLTTSDSCSYINYQDGFSAYCNIKNFTLIKRFELCEKIGDEVVCNRGYWGNLELVDANDNMRILNRKKMWELAGKYIRRAAKIV